MLGLYVHVPFCSAICNYCNFNRGLFDADLKGRYVDALVGEIQAGRASGAGGADNEADTIYFGGGTPSLLEPAEIARVIAACRRSFDVDRNCEITIEANPETVTTARLAGFRDAGVNRVSFGVQSLRDEELRRLSRLHDANRARAAVGEARTAGFDNISVDLMMWLPEQRVDQWLESVDGAIALGPDHLSLYLLEVYPNAPLKDDMARSRWSQAPDEDAAAMYLSALDRLDAAGYLQYEISNVARAGRASRHNVKYWTDGEWLGFGCGAHSTRDGVRWKNVSSTDEYVRRLQTGQSTREDVRRLTPDERLGDALFTALRLSEGVDLEAVGLRYGVDVWRRFGGDLAPFVDEGCLLHEGARLRLTRRGMLLAHEVMTVFV
ncbi:MAG TPA: radical SAM family heme chaperone HemW [Vicinamibacterales bacterium]|nr:radical SAM family heme chaperone HemW [Vicinamibacterales bacterium]